MEPSIEQALLKDITDRMLSDLTNSSDSDYEKIRFSAKFTEDCQSDFQTPFFSKLCHLLKSILANRIESKERFKIVSRTLFALSLILQECAPPPVLELAYYKIDFHSMRKWRIKRHVKKFFDSAPVGNATVNGPKFAFRVCDPRFPDQIPSDLNRGFFADWIQAGALLLVGMTEEFRDFPRQTRFLEELYTKFGSEALALHGWFAGRYHDVEEKLGAPNLIKDRTYYGLIDSTPSNIHALAVLMGTRWDDWAIATFNNGNWDRVAKFGDSLSDPDQWFGVGMSSAKDLFELVCHFGNDGGEIEITYCSESRFDELIEFVRNYKFT